MQESSNWKLFNWELHSVVGLWTLPVVFVFGLVGFYASFPKPIQVLVNKVAPLRVNRLEPSAQLPTPTKFVPLNPSAPGPQRFVRPQPSTGDQIIRWLSYLHFGNFGGWISKTIWVFLGLAPAFLFVTGVLMWFNRVLAPAARRLKRSSGI